MTIEKLVSDQPAIIAEDLESRGQEQGNSRIDLAPISIGCFCLVSKTLCPAVTDETHLDVSLIVLIFMLPVEAHLRCDHAKFGSERHHCPQADPAVERGLLIVFRK